MTHKKAVFAAMVLGLVLALACGNKSDNKNRPVLVYYALPGWPFCAKVSTAVRGLQQEGTYQGKLELKVVDVTTDEIREEIAGWEGLGNHGLVGTIDGKLKVKIPGHKFGRAEIVAKADELLDGDG